MKGFVEYERKNILNFVRCKNMVHMKISIVVLSDNWTVEAFRAEITQKLQRIRPWSYNPSILREGYFSHCSLLEFRQVRILNKIISVSAEQISSRPGGVGFLFRG